MPRRRSSGKTSGTGQQNRMRGKNNGPSFDSVAQYRPQRVPTSVDPRPLDSSIKVIKRIQIGLPYDTTTLGDVTPAVLMAGVPGGLTYWNRVRFEKFEIWSNSSSSGTDTLSVLVSTQDDWSQPTVSFTDTGTYGARRASVGFKLGLLDRARWFSTADATVLFTAKADTGSAGTLVVQATVELLSGSLF
jgi:hypothetical protein